MNSRSGAGPASTGRWPTTRPPAEPEQIEDLLEMLLRIPVSVRRFTTSTADAWRLYRISPALLDYMCERGLPSGRRSGQRVFEATDLSNIAMHLGCSAAAHAARRFWATGLSRPPQAGPARYEVRYHFTCPAPGHAGSCRYRLVLPDCTTVEQAGTAGAPAASRAAIVELRADWPALSPAAKELLDVAAGIRFMRLPHALHKDLDFVGRSRLSDCWGTAKLLTVEGRRRGLPVRSSFGLLVVAPFAAIHNWTEIQVYGRWVPVDPVLLGSMIAWGVLDPRDWSVHRSPGAILCRIAEGETPLVTHEGERVRASFVTRRLPTRPA